MKVSNIILLIAMSFTLVGTSCKKFLDEKSDQNLARPETLDDLQAILDAPAMLAGTVVAYSSADEYYLRYEDWNNSGALVKDGYVWDPNLNNLNDWRNQYTTVFYANTVLFNLKNAKKETDPQRAEQIRAAALFFRSHSFYNLAQLYAPQYDPATASDGLWGIPLRLNANFNEKSVRSSVKATYDQIINDLETATPLLPNTTATLKTRPSKAAGHALLARVYLQMGNFDKARDNSEACLDIYNKLLDFNDANWVDTLSTAAPITRFNPEMIFYINSSSSVLSNAMARVVPALYQLYEQNDLRRIVYFRKNSDLSYRFKGSYNNGSTNLFNGIAVDEVYLILAECKARAGEVASAMQDLNTLLDKRFRTGTFVPLTAANQDEAMNLILNERKKELLYRGSRWSDLRRLNKETKYAIIIKRDLNGDVVELPPNDFRYTLLIPREILNSTDLEQNPR